VVAEGNRVCFEAESDAPLVGGGRYTNTYVIALELRDDKIVTMKEFSDTLHVYEAIDAPETRGPRKDRESPLTTVTDTVEGSVAGGEQ
jgi:hypothetical protein